MRRKKFMLLYIIICNIFSILLTFEQKLFSGTWNTCIFYINYRIYQTWVKIISLFVIFWFTIYKSVFIFFYKNIKFLSTKSHQNIFLHFANKNYVKYELIPFNFAETITLMKLKWSNCTLKLLKLRFIVCYQFWIVCLFRCIFIFPNKFYWIIGIKREIKSLYFLFSNQFLKYVRNFFNLYFVI